MKMKNSFLLLGILLTACGNPVTQENTLNESSSSEAEVQSSSSEQAVPFAKALDRTFSSTKLGIAFRYPSAVELGDCKDAIPVMTREKEYSIEFVVEHMPDETCAYLPSEVFSTIYAQKAAGIMDVRQFIDRVFSPDCEISEESEYEENGDAFTRVFLQCSESVLWNRTTGVVMFSPLGSKTGGGSDWPSPRAILMPDGSVEYAFDYPIMQSIQFLNAE